MRYHPQQTLSASLGSRHQFWRTAAGAALITGVYLGLILAIFGVIVALADAATQRGVIDGLAFGSSPGVTLAALYSFLAMLLGLAIACGALHRINILQLAGPLRTVWRDFIRVLRMLLLLYLGVMALGWIIGTDSPDPMANLPFDAWIKFLPFALVGVLLQTATEELTFRGYLQGFLAARFRSPMVWMLAPAVVFGLGHYSADNGDNTWLIVLGTTLFGLAAADLTARTGSIGAALGFHFMNNVGALLLVALSGPMSGLALYVYPFGTADIDLLRPLLVLDLAMLLVSWLACRLACRV